MPGDHFYAKFSNTLGARGLRWAGKLNVPVYRLSGGRIGSKVGDGPVLLLTTTGRKSGEPRTAPVLYLAHGDAMILIDTNGGNEKLPGWSHNLKAEAAGRGRDRPPQARGRRAGRRGRRARRSSGSACNEQYAASTNTSSGSNRTPSVWVLEPRRRDERQEDESQADVGTTREAPPPPATPPSATCI